MVVFLLVCQSACSASDGAVCMCVQNEEDEGVDVNGNDNNENSEAKEQLSRQPSDRSQRSKR